MGPESGGLLEKRETIGMRSRSGALREPDRPLVSAPMVVLDAELKKPAIGALQERRVVFHRVADRFAISRRDAPDWNNLAGRSGGGTSCRSGTAESARHVCGDRARGVRRVRPRS